MCTSLLSTLKNANVDFRIRSFFSLENDIEISQILKSTLFSIPFHLKSDVLLRSFHMPSLCDSDERISAGDCSMVGASSNTSKAPPAPLILRCPQILNMLSSRRDDGTGAGVLGATNTQIPRAGTRATFLRLIANGKYCHDLT